MCFSTSYTAWRGRAITLIYIEQNYSIYFQGYNPKKQRDCPCAVAHPSCSHQNQISSIMSNKGCKEWRAASQSLHSTISCWNCWAYLVHFTGLQVLYCEHLVLFNSYIQCVPAIALLRQECQQHGWAMALNFRVTTLKIDRNTLIFSIYDSAIAQRCPAVHSSLDSVSESECLTSQFTM